MNPDQYDCETPRNRGDSQAGGIPVYGLKALDELHRVTEYQNALPKIYSPVREVNIRSNPYSENKVGTDPEKGDAVKLNLMQSWTTPKGGSPTGPFNARPSILQGNEDRPPGPEIPEFTSQYKEKSGSNEEAKRSKTLSSKFKSRRDQSNRISRFQKDPSRLELPDEEIALNSNEVEMTNPNEATRNTMLEFIKRMEPFSKSFQAKVINKIQTYDDDIGESELEKDFTAFLRALLQDAKEALPDRPEEELKEVVQSVVIYRKLSGRKGSLRALVERTSALKSKSRLSKELEVVKPKLESYLMSAKQERQLEEYLESTCEAYGVFKAYSKENMMGQILGHLKEMEQLPCFLMKTNPGASIHMSVRNFLYRPKLNLRVPKLTNNSVYYSGTYVEFRNTLSFFSSKLLQPLKKIVGSRASVVERKESLVRKNIEEAKVQRLLSLNLARGITAIMDTFDKPSFFRRYLDSSASHVEESSLMSSVFFADFINGLVLPFYHLHVDFNLYQRYFIALDDVLKLQALYLLRNSGYIFQAIEGLDETQELADVSSIHFLLQTMVMEIRYFLVLAREVYDKFLHESLFGAAYVSHRRIMLLVINQRVGDHLTVQSDALSELSLTDVKPDISPPDIITPDSLFSKNFGSLNDLQEVYLKLILIFSKP